MPRHDADRNLLFGITALQNDFITRDALIAAMAAWAVNKDRSIGKILVEAKALDPLDRDWLEGMFARRLAKHDDNPAAGLAALSSAGSVADDLRRSIADPDLLASIAQISTDPFATRAPGPNETLPPGFRFRKLREHAAGNLGVVYVARDQELNRDVALKEIKERNADHPHNQAKFLLEAEVTGGLEHPGIVPVYGLGHHLDGRPYYAMRFIRGKSLLDAIKKFHADESLQKDPGKRLLELQKLLRRFTDVCNAIAYAHSRGVLHRDLKPDNVMVGRYGETLVVDWGLAKALGTSGEGTATILDQDDPLPEASLQPTSADGIDATHAGALVGTPAYMSPEQAAGRLDLLGPASDIYGLGATLYHLIVGRPPVSATSLGELLLKIQAGDIPRPRSVVPGIDPALEAICLKAMARNPGHRYDSSSSLARDVEGWVADEPVTAYHEPLSRRAARWAKRHRSAALALGLSLATAVVVLTISNLLINRARQETVQALDRVRQEQGRTAEALARADANFRRARQAVAEYFTLVSQDVLLDEPGMQPLRQTLLSAALRYHETFLRERSADPDIEAELAESHRAYGKIALTLGRTQESEKNLRAAIALWEQLTAKYPDRREYRRQRAMTRADLGHSWAVLGRSRTETITADREAVEDLRGLLSGQDRDEELQATLATSLASLGMSRSSERAGSEEAARLLSESRAILNRLVAEHPDSVAYRVRIAEVNQLLYDSVIGDRSRQAEALEESTRSIATFRGLIERYPNSPRFKYKAGVLLSTRATIHRRAERFDAAITDLDEALALLRDVVRTNPDAPLYMIAQARASNALGDTFIKIGASHRALGPLREACAVYERYLKLRPDDLVAQRMSLSSLMELGSALGEPGHFDESASLLERAIELAPSVMQSDPTNIFAKGSWIMTQMNLGLTLSRADRHEKAVLAFEAYEALLRDNPGFDPAHGGQEEVEYLVTKAYSLREVGRANEARAIVAQARAARAQNRTTQFELAAYDARGADLLDRAGGDPAAVRVIEDRAWNSLVSAVNSGYDDINWLRHFQPIERLRHHPGFDALVNDLGFPTNPFLSP